MNSVKWNVTDLMMSGERTEKHSPEAINDITSCLAQFYIFNLDKVLWEFRKALKMWK